MRSKVRWLVVGMIFAASVLNYVDRQTLSLLAPTVQRDLGMTNQDYALVLNCFLAAYTAAYLLSGPLVDRIGIRLGFAVYVGWWSVANMLTGFASSVFSLAFFRSLLGLGEAGNWTAAPKAVGEWFPPRERGLAVGIYTLGGTIGATIAPVVVLWLAARSGWRSAFVATGTAGLVWLIPWWFLYGNAEKRAGRPASAVLGARQSWWRFLRMKEVWLLMLARLLTDPVWFFFQFWFAKYLHDARGVPQSGLVITWVIFLAADVGGLTGGWLSGRLITSRRAPPASRLWVMLGCAVLVPCEALIPGMGGLTPVLIVGMIAVFAHMAWLINLSALVVDLAPPQGLGAIFGLVAAGSSAGGILMNQAVGGLLAHHSYDAAFHALAVLHPLALCILWRLRREPGSQRLTDVALAQG